MFGGGEFSTGDLGIFQTELTSLVLPPPSRTGGTLLDNPEKTMASVDFSVAVAAHPTAEWTAQPPRGSTSLCRTRCRPSPPRVSGRRHRVRRMELVTSPLMVRGLLLWVGLQRDSADPFPIQSADMGRWSCNARSGRTPASLRAEDARSKRQKGCGILPFTRQHEVSGPILLTLLCSWGR